MKSLVNENVSHSKFGSGIIVAEESQKIRVQFANLAESKLFAFPIAFEKFLVLKDGKLQEECHTLAVQKRQELKQEEENRLEEIRRIAEEKRRERLEAAKLKRKAAAKRTASQRSVTAKRAAAGKKAVKKSETAE